MNESCEAIMKGLPFIQAMRGFNHVVDSCFGNSLSPDYKEAITSFRKVYLELGITVTPKVYLKN